WDDVRPRREELAELDVGGTEALDIARQLLGLGHARRALVRLLRQELVQPGACDEIAPSILPEEQREVLVALEVLRPQRQVHCRRTAICRPGERSYSQRRVLGSAVLLIRNHS